MSTEQRSIKEFMNEWIARHANDPKYEEHHLTDAEKEELKSLKTFDDLAEYARQKGFVLLPISKIVWDIHGFEIRFFKEVK